ncbi:MAG: T9SS type A sorting domain-containing protein, partial [Bacteroidales bacterium]
AKDNTNLVISMSENSSAVITVTDILGREVINLGNRSLGVGENNIEINTSSLSNGTYLVRIASENGISTKKFNISK